MRLILFVRMTRATSSEEANALIQRRENNGAVCLLFAGPFSALTRAPSSSIVSPVFSMILSFALLLSARLPRVLLSISMVESGDV